MLREITERRSVRKYLDQPVEKEKIVQMVESARMAPSGDNTQPWHFMVVQSSEMRRKLMEISNQQKWMLGAPVYVVCIADLALQTRAIGGDVYAIDENSPQSDVKDIIRDTAVAAEHLVLEAQHLGLGTCWVAWFSQQEIRPLLHIPDDKYVVALITVGYASKKPSPRPRRDLCEMIHWETWGGR